MCIWKVKKSDRQCEYCSYYKGCEMREEPTENKDLPAAVFAVYFYAMFRASGIDAREHTRKREVVWARNMLAFRLYTDGYSKEGIGDMVGLDRTTIVHCIKMVQDMLKMPNLYQREMRMWMDFTKFLSLAQN